MEAHLEVESHGDLVLMALQVEQQGEAVVLNQLRHLRLGHVLLVLHLREQVLACMPPHPARSILCCKHRVAAPLAML